MCKFLISRPRLARGCVLLGVVAVAYFTRSWTLPCVARFLDVSEPPRRTTAVMVLGGGTDIRPFVAAAIVKAKLADKVLVAPIKLSPQAEDGLADPEHEVIVRVLLTRGVARDKIEMLNRQVENTFDEAQALSDYLDENPNSSVAVISTTWHTRRARWAMKRVLGERISQVYFVGAPTERFDENNWWSREDGIFIVDEYIKLCHYAIKY